MSNNSSTISEIINRIIEDRSKGNSTIAEMTKPKLIGFSGMVIKVSPSMVLNLLVIFSSPPYAFSYLRVVFLSWYKNFL